MLQVVENWEKRSVVDSLSIEDLFNRVKNPSKDFVEKVVEMRCLTRKSKEFNDIKKTLPCFTTAFNFNGYISNKNLGKATGYLYLDVDNVEDIKLEHSSIVFYCKSISGKGYSIIVGVKGVTAENIKEVTKSIAKELNIELDEAAISKDRLTVLSYDINAYYNPNHTYFEYEGFYPHVISKHIYNNNSYEWDGGKIRQSNIEDIQKSFEFNGDAYIDFGSNKLGYTKLKTPFKTVFDGRRNKVMNNICYTLKGLNPWISKHRMKCYLESVNSSKIVPALGDAELEAIVDSVFRIKEITLYPNTFIRILYNPDYDLTTKERKSVSLIAINKQRGLDVKSSIETVVNNWDFALGKITQKKLIEVSKRNKKTIEKYYPELKQKINILNLSNSNK